MTPSQYCRSVMTCMGLFEAGVAPVDGSGSGECVAAVCAAASVTDAPAIPAIPKTAADFKNSRRFAIRSVLLYTLRARASHQKSFKLGREYPPNYLFNRNFLDVDVGHRQAVQHGFANGDDAVAFHLERNGCGGLAGHFAILAQLFG